MSECGEVLRANEGRCWEKETLLSDTGGSVQREAGKVFESVRFVSAGLTEKGEQSGAVAHLSEVRALFVLRASPSAFALSGPT